METGSVLQRKGAGQPQISKLKLNLCKWHIPEALKSPFAMQLQIPRSTIHKVLHRNLQLYTYKVQLLQALKPED